MNWIRYADAIGDYSYKLIFNKKIEDNFFDKILKKQLSLRKEDLLL